MARSDGFWDRIAERYAKKPVGDEVAYQKKLAVTQYDLGTVTLSARRNVLFPFRLALKVTVP